MSCNHPLKGFVLGVNNNGKKILKITNYRINYIVKKYINGKISYVCCDTPYVQYAPCQYDVGVITDYIDIPCGKCIACRRRNAANWTDRLLLELEDHTTSCFVTLTYDDDHINRVNEPSGDSDDYIFTLNKRDLQLFIKRLRKSIEPAKIRFFACGEYGTNTFRPHYHIIIFGFCPDDLVLLKRNHQGDELFTSDSLYKIWGNGIVSVGRVTQQSCRYVARYCVKKALGVDRDFYVHMGVLPEFIDMSRRPGIGRKYFDDHYDDIVKYKTINVKTPDSGVSMHVPPYYINLIESIDLDLYRDIKDANRLAAQRYKNVLLDNLGMDYVDYLDMCEDKLLRREQKYMREVD